MENKKQILAVLWIVFITISSISAQAQLSKEIKITNNENSYPFWAPDGQQIVFQSNRSGGNSDIYTINYDGSVLKRLTHSLGDDLTPVWSPDGKNIAFQSDRDGNNEIFIMNNDGSKERNITLSEYNEMHPKWHPYEDKIIFSAVTGYWNVVDHWEIMADGTNLQRITRNVSIDTYAEWSPDGNQIIARKIIGVNSEIYLFDKNGKNEMNLTNDPAFDGWPSWHPDGKSIVYASEDEKGIASIYELHLKDNSKNVLISGNGSWAKPIWNRDGDQLLCTRQLNGNVDIFVYDVNSNNEDQLSILGAVNNSYPSFSPDGKTIVFHSDRFGDNDIYTINSDGTGLKRLTDSPGNDRTPVFSPDGKKIAFVSTRSGNYDVFIMNADGSEELNLTKNPNSKDIHPYWSKDGSLIFFNSSRVNNIYGIYSMKADGEKLRRVENNGGENTHASLSPKGDKIVFRKLLEEEGWKSDIFIMDADGRNEKRLTNTPGSNEFPAWSIEGKKIIFTSNDYDSKTGNIFLMDSNGGNKINLTNNTQKDKLYFSPTFSEDGKSIICTIKQNGSEDIYLIPFVQ